jgi:transcriptional regulator with XRE-family HTH domain
MAKKAVITPIDMYVINFVRRLRQEKKIGQEMIAAIIETHRTFITNIESPNHPAKYNLNHINALAFYFDMSPRDFLPREAIDPSI